MLLSYVALLGRIVLLGYEKIIVKKLGDKSGSISGAFFSSKKFYRKVFVTYKKKYII